MSLHQSVNSCSLWLRITCTPSHCCCSCSWKGLVIYEWTNHSCNNLSPPNNNNAGFALLVSEDWLHCSIRTKKNSAHWNKAHKRLFWSPGGRGALSNQNVVLTRVYLWVLDMTKFGNPLSNAQTKQLTRFPRVRLWQTLTVSTALVQAGMNEVILLYHLQMWNKWKA